MKLLKNDRNNKKLFFSLENLSSEVIRSCPGAIYMYKIMIKIYVVRVQISHSEIYSR